MNTYYSIKLSHLNPSFVIPGNEQKRNIELQKVEVEEGDPKQIALEIVDEKEITIFHEPLVVLSDGKAEEALVNRNFAFYDHLTVKMQGESDMPFTVKVFYQL